MPWKRLDFSFVHLQHAKKLDTRYDKLMYPVDITHV